LWLRDEEYAWRLPDALYGRFAKVFEGVEDGKQVFPLEAFVRSSAAGKSGALKDDGPR